MSRPCPWVCPCSTSPTPPAQFQVLLRVLGHCRIATRTSVRCPPSCPQWMSTKVLRAALLQMKDRTTVLMMKYLIFIFLNSTIYQINFVECTTSVRSILQARVKKSLKGKTATNIYLTSYTDKINWEKPQQTKSKQSFISC